MINLSGQTALVTGASRGIGHAVAAHLAKLGASVVLVARSADALAETVALIEKEGGQAAAFPADLADSEAARKAVAFAIDTYGGLDILVNNAGVTRDNLLLRLSEEDWDTVLTLNLKTAYVLTKAAARVMMKKRRGRVINISSVVGLTGNPGQANYAAAKAGLVGLTKTIAKEFASRNITANVIAPGFIDTQMTAGMSDEIRQATLAQIPLTHYGTAQDVAGVVGFLASDLAAYITGEVIRVDGGLAM